HRLFTAAVEGGLQMADLNVNGKTHQVDVDPNTPLLWVLRVKREAAMNYVPKIDRRSFVVSAAAVGGGLALGLDLPFGGPEVIRAQDGSPEVNAWVVIRPDDTVVIRIARSEIGQGTLTGLAPTRRRGTRMRLVEGHDRISHARPERRPQARVGRHVDRRQPGHEDVTGIR